MLPSLAFECYSFTHLLLLLLLLPLHTPFLSLSTHPAPPLLLCPSSQSIGASLVVLTPHSHTSTYPHHRTASHNVRHKRVPCVSSECSQCVLILTGVPPPLYTLCHSRLSLSPPVTPSLEYHITQALIDAQITHSGQACELPPTHRCTPLLYLTNSLDLTLLTSSLHLHCNVRCTFLAFTSLHSYPHLVTHQAPSPPTTLTHTAASTIRSPPTLSTASELTFISTSTLGRRVALGVRRSVPDLAEPSTRWGAYLHASTVVLSLSVRSLHCNALAHCKTDDRTGCRNRLSSHVPLTSASSTNCPSEI